MKQLPVADRHRTLWITWENQRRNVSMARLLSAELHALQAPDRGVRRYLWLIRATLELLRTRKPEVVYFQNPSLLLGVLLAVMRQTRIYRGALVGDYHNAGIWPSIGTLGHVATKWVARRSDLVIVTNGALAAVVESWGATPAVIPDPVPRIAASSRRPSSQNLSFEILFICSWAADEPVAEVVAAARLLDEQGVEVRISITGRPKIKERIGETALPTNVHLTGFLSDHDFEVALAGCDAVMDLTTRPDCMVCGAYEAVACGKPGVLSANTATVEYFDGGFLFTDNSAADIARKIVQLKEQHQMLVVGVHRLGEKLVKHDQHNAQLISDALSERRGNAPD